MTFRTLRVFMPLAFLCVTTILLGQSKHAGELKLKGGYYVSARPGLNYRDAPNGKVLGVFPLNTQLTIAKVTEVEDQVIEAGKKIKGRWLGVIHEKDTVYVFDQYLSQSPALYDIRLFWAEPYYESREGPEFGFINLSELYFASNVYSGNPMGQGQGNNPTRFSSNQTDRFLRRMGFSRKDTLFIFNLPKDSIYKYPLNTLEAAAYMDPYGSDLEYGLSLEKRYTEKGENLSYLGSINPFQTGNTHVMIWKKVEDSEFPVASYPLKENISLETYTLTYGPYEYFLQSHIYTKKNYQRVDIHHIVIRDTETGLVISEWHYQSGESTFLLGASTQDDPEKVYNSYAWTGALIKGKSPIFYGMFSTPFGCPFVQFIDRKEPNVGILCDNRH